MRFTNFFVELDWRRRRRSRGESSEQERSPLRCSFCNKSQSDVGKLIAGPSVFICDECIAMCLDIIEEDRRLSETVASQPDRARESDTSVVSGGVALCSLCRLPVPMEHLVAIANRGPLCQPCVDAVVMTQTGSDDEA